MPHFISRGSVCFRSGGRGNRKAMRKQIWYIVFILLYTKSNTSSAARIIRLAIRYQLEIFYINYNNIFWYVSKSACESEDTGMNWQMVICYPMSVIRIDSLSPASFSSTDTHQGDYVRVYPTHDPVKAKLYTLLLQSSSRISLPGMYTHCTLPWLQMPLGRG